MKQNLKQNQIKEIEAIEEQIKQAKSILLVSHVSPDADTIGSALALYGMLIQMGKEVCICCENFPPRNISFLPWIEKVTGEVAGYFDLAVALDCADIMRLGNMQNAFNSAKAKIVIDHHQSNEGFGNINWIDPDAAATAELVYQLLEHFGNDITREMAACLYAALVGDTGNFAYSNTRAYSFEMAAQLLKKGIDMPDIVRQMFRKRTRSNMRLLAIAGNNVRYFADGKIAMMLLDMPMIEGIPLASGDHNGIVEFLRDQEGVEVAIFAREAAKNQYKISLRSVNKVNVAQIAEKFSGGGHVRAAGCQIEADLYQVGNLLLEEALKAFEETDNDRNN